MTAARYRFRNFTLDPRSRELHRDGERLSVPVSTIECMAYLIRHRDRSVGRDELIAAVWGRADVSEVSLSHAIMRARRLLGDSGSEQRSIRTLPRLGYRWVIEPTIEEPTAEVVAAIPIISLPSAPDDVSDSALRAHEPAAVVPRASQRSRSRFVLPTLIVCLLALATAAAWFIRRESVRSHATTSATAAPTAMVLPAEVDGASPDWAWLRLGAMDLIANRLRLGGIATTPSETVVGLVNAGRIDTTQTGPYDAAVVGADTLVVRPVIGKSDDTWSIRLTAVRGTTVLDVETSAPDVLAATRSAADDLLVKLGHAPPSALGADPPPSAAELAQRVSAALLSGQTALATQLIAQAPPALAATPEIALAEANIDYTGGRYPAAMERIDALLDRVPTARFPLLRARTLNLRGATRYQSGELHGADDDFVQAIGLLELHNDPDALAKAYSGRGAVAGLNQQWDEAIGFFGHARALRQMIDDAYGVASADLNLGAVEMARGRPAAAVPLFEAVAQRLQELGTPEALATALRDLANAQLALLRYDDALATTARFWPIDARGGNAHQRWQLTLMRAAALAGKGRLHEADFLIERIEHDSDPLADAFERADAASLAADIALQRGDHARAADLALQAMTPAYAARGGVAYASAWLERTRGLQRSGQTEVAAAEVARFDAWAKSETDPRKRLLAALAGADQAAAEGRAEQARSGYAAALTEAERIGVPEYLILVGEPYVQTLLAADQLDEAGAVAGRLGEFAAMDAHAAWLQALLYASLNKPTAAEKAYAKARELAGEGVLPPLPGSITH